VVEKRDSCRCMVARLSTQLVPPRFFGRNYACSVSASCCVGPRISLPTCRQKLVFTLACSAALSFGFFAGRDTPLLRTTKPHTRKNITMKRILPVGRPRFTYALIVCALIVGTIDVGSVIAADKNAKVALVYEHALPNVPGKSIKGVLVEYGPGGTSPAHTHPKSAFIYATVLEGAIRSSVNDGPVVTYRTGQSFSEMPGDRHSVSENASKTEPAKLLAVFVVDTDEKELTTPYEK
jgi:quercetin dioxygenase-like cupin family protein